MNLLALLLGWLIARTVRVVPADQFSPPPPPPPPPGGGGRRPHTRPHVPRPATPRGSTVPASHARAVAAPWPQVVPAGLPSFPGSGWVPDSPPPPDVVSRASALLKQLWQGGVGTFKTEKIGARWITFRATDFPGGKRGVVAYRLANPQIAPQGSTTTANIQVGPTVLPPGRGPGAVPKPFDEEHALGLPTLRRGSRGEEVKILQRKLGLTDDGVFGGDTDAAVRAFQRNIGLFVDGVVGRDTWAALMGRGVFA